MIDLESIMLVFILLELTIFVIEITLIKVLMRIKGIEMNNDSSK